MDDYDLIPRCSHGYIVLGCPHVPCSEQDAYVASIKEAQDNWYQAQQKAARDYVRSILGLPTETEDDETESEAKD